MLIARRVTGSGVSAVWARLGGGITLRSLDGLPVARRVLLEAFELVDGPGNERVREGQLGREALFRLPLCALVNEVDKILIRTAHLSVQILGTRHTYATTRVRHNYRIVVLVKENLTPGRSRENGPRWDALDFHHEGHVFFLVFTWEQWVANIQLV